MSQQVTTRLVLAMVISRLDYCNAALAGLPQATIAPQVTTGTELGGLLDFRAEHQRACHAMSVTVALATSTLAHPVQTVLRYALHLPRTCPAYLSNIVEPVGVGRTRPRLRSTSTTDFSLPPLRTKFGERSFSHAGPSVWNDLPEDLRAVADSAKFRQQLKTYFFTRAFNFQ